jgi:hypothetical protein
LNQFYLHIFIYRTPLGSKLYTQVAQLVHTISLLGVLCSSLRNGSGKVLEHGDGAVPVDASVGDGHALLESAGALGWDLLVALVDV